MNLGFDRLTQISDVNEWKSAYHTAIKNLDDLYQEEERIYYLMYSQEHDSNRIEEIQHIKHELMTNKELIHTFTVWKERLRDEPIWCRRMDVLLSRMKQESLDSHPEIVKIQQALQKKLMESTFKVDGKEYNLGTVHSNVMENPDRKLRKKLFLESKRIGRENEELYRTLIQKRNQLAQGIGYDNYYHFRCSLKEINIESYIAEMDALLKNLEDSSAYWSNRINEKFGWESMHFYDQYFTTFNFHRIQGSIFTSERLKEVLSDAVNSLGIPLQSISVTIETLEIPYGGFAVNINPNELKLVVNKRDAYSVVLSGMHEMGHILDGHYGSFDYPEFYRFYSSIAAESIAELFQTIVTDEKFLKRNFDLTDEILGQIKDVNALTDFKLVQINYYYSLVEYELYRNPERSFQEIADECYKTVFGYEGETFHPGSEMFYIENPAFFQDYNFALAVRDMIRGKFKIKSLYNNREVFSELLEKYIEPNQLYSWQERVKRLCDEDFTFSYLADTLSKVIK
ncbi:M3 family metallopeptidase [Cytobacillus sp. FJAT-54145]|uniref:M3 family metallopeptidase n=1 Tax=Cytobacillus spartinae TaxID=3299023 RepID=A0ABW6KDN6_9BACI